MPLHAYFFKENCYFIGDTEFSFQLKLTILKIDETILKQTFLTNSNTLEFHQCYTVHIFHRKVINKVSLKYTWIPLTVLVVK